MSTTPSGWEDVVILPVVSAPFDDSLRQSFHRRHPFGMECEGRKGFGSGRKPILECVDLEPVRDNESMQKLRGRLARIAVEPVFWLAIVTLLGAVAAAGSIVNVLSLQDFVLGQTRQARSIVYAIGYPLSTILGAIGCWLLIGKKLTIGYLLVMMECFIGIATLGFDATHHFVGTETGFFGLLRRPRNMRWVTR